ncbi:probable chitinase 10 [Topomyia yanbarensis]|uniref:probable chitinase 10 n=1 Tax=Topomyia yanbarensis TaxID=2498891 RepID=UPI00273AE9A5|nr:probable chitinase 10 [Topomyia yanbarensis]
MKKMIRVWFMVILVVSINYHVTAQEDNPCRGNEGVHRVPDPADCTRFFLCIGEESFPTQCGPGLIFDVLTGHCNEESVSVCVQEIESPPTPSGPGEGTTSPGVTTPSDIPEAPTPTPGPTTVAPTAPTPSPTPSPAPTTTTVPEAPTPSPTIAPPPITTTTTPAPTPAPTTPPTTVPTPAPTTARPPGTPDCPVNEEFYAPHPDCTKYYRCYFGRLFVMTCPPNLHWNQEQLFCDHIWNVPCPSAWVF